MKKNKTTSVCFFVFLFCFYSSLFSQKTGVLIGLRHDVKLDAPLPYGETRDAARRSHYRTLWISMGENKSVSIFEIENLLVPRKNDFWKISVVRQKEADWVEDFLVASPFNQKIPVNPAVDSLTVAQCEGNKRLSIIFVGTDYLSYEGSSDGYCQDAAHPWHVNYLKTVLLDDVSREGVNISDVLGGEAKTALFSGAEKYLAQTSNERLNPTPEEKNWGLIRRRGHWILRGQLDYSSEVYRGHFAHFDIPMNPPQHLAGYDQLTLSWKKIKQDMPSARDAMTSPDNNLLIILTKDQILVYSVSDLEIIKEVNLLQNEFLVMVQWALNKRVDRWNAVFKDYLSTESSKKMQYRFR